MLCLHLHRPVSFEARERDSSTHKSDKISFVSEVESENML